LFVVSFRIFLSTVGQPVFANHHPQLIPDEYREEKENEKEKARKRSQETVQHTGTLTARPPYRQGEEKEGNFVSHNVINIQTW